MAATHAMCILFPIAIKQKNTHAKCSRAFSPDWISVSFYTAMIFNEEVILANVPMQRRTSLVGMSLANAASKLKKIITMKVATNVADTNKLDFEAIVLFCILLQNQNYLKPNDYKQENKCKNKLLCKFEQIFIYVQMKELNT